MHYFVRLGKPSLRRNHNFTPNLASHRAVCDHDRTMVRFTLPTRWILAGLVTATLISAALLEAQEKTLPNAEALRQRALETYQRTAEQREKYECRERQVQNDLDGKGHVKKSTVIDQDFFFYNGRPILREVTHDGKPLSASDQRKQDDRVRKEIAEAEKQAKNQNREKDTFSSGNLVRMAKLANERRVLVANRPTIVFDVLDDPGKKTSSIPEKIISNMRGTMSIDEETGQMQDVNVAGVRDVKIGGGMLANVHKGFSFHAVLGPQSDGVWLVKTLYGSGDARVGLFFHPSANFRSDVLNCHLFNVSSDQVVKQVEGNK